MIVLGIAAWFLVLLLLLGIASLSVLYLERRELLARADALSLEAASDIGGSYYTDGRLGPGGAQQVRQVASSATDDKTRVSEPTGIEEGAVVVSLSRRVRVRFLPEFVPLSSVDVEVTSRSKLQPHNR